MPSVETQTTWSWMQDLSVLGKLRSEHAELELSFRDLNKDLTAGKKPTSPGVESNATQDNTDQLFRSYGFMPVKSEDQDLTESSPESDTASHTATEPEQTNELRLPKITKTPTIQSQNDDDTERKIEDVKLPLVVSPESPTADLSDPDTPDEDEIEETYTELFNLPWPKILQYMRESESYAAKCFSLKNKRNIAKRLEANKIRSPIKEKKINVASKLQEEASTDSESSSEESELDSSEVDEVDGTRKKNDEKEQLQTCDFCGKDKPKYSLLSTRTGAKKSELADIDFCCEENRDFSVLVATCLRQLVDKLQNGPPRKIAVNLTKKQVKKTAEQRAFALMCRKRKWEQLLQKKMQKDKTPGRTNKQTRTIQFSLLSTETLDTGWMIRPQSKTKHCTSRKRKILNRTEKKKRVNILAPGLLKRLQHDRIEDTELDLKVYGDNTSHVTLLPNRTGQCYYRSGNIAVAVFSPYAGVLAYLLYEDSTKALLGYLDELGRIGCYYTDGKLQLYSGQDGGVLFEPDGTVRRRWSWDSPNNSFFQPTNITLNKHLTVKCQSRAHSTITFSSEHKVIKFSVDCVLQKDEKLGIAVDPSYTIWLADQLQQSKKQISGLLQGMQMLSRQRKLAQLKSVYDPLGKERPQQQQRGARQRTRSTGSIPLTHKQSALKHRIS